MAYKKNWRSNTTGALSPISGYGGGGGIQPGFKNYQSTLPDVYTGHPNRIERYTQYENMDLDSEIRSALDIIADFSTQVTKDNNTAFEVMYYEKPTASEIEIINSQLKNWYKMNEFDRRMFKIFRNTIKYGDQIFLRDPETFILEWIDNSKVIKIIVNESEGKSPEQYVIRDLNPNFQNLTATSVAAMDTYTMSPQMGGPTGAYTMPNNPYGNSSRFTIAANENAVPAQHVLHFSLSEGLDVNWPFGNSVLEDVFKVFKQKELIEDAIIIYRIQRAPERRVFKVDCGSMPAHLAMAFVERLKNEIHQKRIPTQTGGGMNMADATYNPLSINEDYFFPITSDGRGSSVDVLPGGMNLGEIDDLKFFTNKLFRGLRVPSSYLPTGPDDGTTSVNDGRVGTALIQEHRFNQYCKRIQGLISPSFDLEFKMFLRWRGFNIDNSLFELKFNEPQNFSSYRQIELDSARINAYGSVKDISWMSQRWAAIKYLGLTEDDLAENTKMWLEEQGEPDGTGTKGSDLRNVSITPGDFSGDIDNIEGADQFGQEGEFGGVPGEAGNFGGSTTAPPGGPAGDLGGPPGGNPA